MLTKVLFALVYEGNGLSKPVFIKDLFEKEYETVDKITSTPYLSVQLATATRVEGKDEWILDNNPYYKIVLEAEQPTYIKYSLKKVEDGNANL